MLPNMQQTKKIRVEIFCGLKSQANPKVAQIPENVNRNQSQCASSHC